jgi:hypothetical protein
MLIVYMGSYPFLSGICRVYVRLSIYVKVGNSVVDPDPHGSALIKLSWIRIQVQGKTVQKGFCAYCTVHT